MLHGDVPLAGPVVLGHEGVGRIAELGEGPAADYAGTPVTAGDRVYWSPVRPCHRCYYCTVVKDYSLCERLAEGLFGAADAPSAASYLDYAWLPGGMPYFRIPDDTPSEAVIALGCALPTILQGIERLGYIRPGETVVVQGAGPVGLAATLVAKVSGAHSVTVVGAPARRLEMARRFGATATVNLDEVTEPAARVAAVRAAGPGADVVIEAAGVLAAFPEGLRFLAPGGRYLIVGLWSGAGEVGVDPRFLNNSDLTVTGTALAQPEHYWQAIRFAQAHHREYPMAEAVTHRYPIDRAQEALEAVSRLETVKAVISPSAGGR
jgi:5-exo-hydroxycamphor dehydrogenase